MEVHVSYPNDLHDLHNDLLFMCEKRKIIGAQKLVLNLYDKKKYVIHIVALDQVLKHGLVLDKVHQVMAYLERVMKLDFISEGISRKGDEVGLQIRNCLQQEPDRVRDGKDPSCNEQTHLSRPSHP